MANFYASYPLQGVDGGGAITQLTGDVTAVGPGSAVATVQFVGGKSAAAVASAVTEVQNAAVAATPSTLVLRDSEGNVIFNNSVSNVDVTVSAGSTTMLASANALEQLLTGTMDQTYQLPDATTLRAGWNYEINNNSSGIAPVTDHGGTNLLTIPSLGWVRMILTDASTANGVWDWHFFLPSNSFPAASSALQGVYQTDIQAPGSLSLSGDTVINGDLTVQGDLTNSGGYALTVQGDVRVTGSFNFTPSNPAGAQGDVLIGQGFLFGAASEMKANNGSSASLTVGGNFINTTNNILSFDCSGNGTGAHGLDVFVGGNLVTVSLDVSGTSAASGSAAGNGGNVTVMGDAGAVNIYANGGDISGVSNPRTAGNGGTLTCNGNVTLWQELHLNGGACGSPGVAGGTGGTGGSLTCYELISFNGGTVTLNGGDAINNTPGAGGSLTAFGTIAGGLVQLAGGNGSGAGTHDSTGGAAGSLTCLDLQGNVSVGLTGGSGNHNGNGGNSSDVNVLGDCNIQQLVATGGAGAGTGVDGNGGNLTVAGTLTCGTAGGIDLAGATPGTISASAIVYPSGLSNLTAPTLNGNVYATAFVGTLDLTNSAPATVAVGTLANKFEVFDAAGNSLGFVPVYSTIT